MDALFVSAVHETNEAKSLSLYPCTDIITNNYQTLNPNESPTSPQTIVTRLNNTATTTTVTKSKPIQISSYNSTFLTTNNNMTKINRNILNKTERFLQNSQAYDKSNLSSSASQLPVYQRRERPSKLANVNFTTDVNRHEESILRFTSNSMSGHSQRSTSSPQLTVKPVTRSKVYRRTSLRSSPIKLNLTVQPSKTINYISKSHLDMHKCESTRHCIDSLSKSYDSAKDEIDNDLLKNKWDSSDVRITCNPLSSPYPYSTPCHDSLNYTSNDTKDDEPKTHSCGNFLPIFSLIPQTVVSFQYLSPKMKFSWWRNKIS